MPTSRFGATGSEGANATHEISGATSGMDPIFFWPQKKKVPTSSLNIAHFWGFFHQVWVNSPHETPEFFLKLFSYFFRVMFQGFGFSDLH